MKITKFNMVAARTVAAGCVLGLFLAAQSASACTLQSWSSVSGAVAPGGPNPDETNNEVQSPRYSGLCAMAASEQGFVEDTNPGGIDRIRARFYVLADNTADAVVYEGFNGSTSIFTVGLGADGAVTLSGDGISQSLTAAGVSGNWNSIEIDWDAGGGQIALWVNSDADSENPDSSGSLTSSELVSSVRLGNLNSAAGALSFDAYESRRTTAVGQLLRSDANADGARNSQDIAEMVNELLGSSLAPGQVDCNEDGEINSQDLACLVNILLS
ncbi:MAG: dockerin type I domain-containing protein [Pseudomonadota bacterium]